MNIALWPRLAAVENRVMFAATQVLLSVRLGYFPRFGSWLAFNFPVADSLQLLGHIGADFRFDGLKLRFTMQRREHRVMFKEIPCEPAPTLLDGLPQSG